MNPTAAAALINLLGYVTGAALYAMLLVMILSGQHAHSAFGTDSNKASDRLPLLTAVLGLAWNLGALATQGLHSLGVGRPWPALAAIAFTALGFLPAVVVHTVLRAGAEFKRNSLAWWMTVTAYALSSVAGLFHFYETAKWGVVPSHWALHILTFGFALLILILLVVTRRQPGWQRACWVAALAVFAVSASHLSHHDGGNYSLWIELIGHHASLPLALVILYQDYRFALADIFLKRALSFVLLVGLSLGLYLLAATWHNGPGDTDTSHATSHIGLLLALWVGTALMYPSLRRMVSRFVDTVILHRSDYEAVRAEIAQRIAVNEIPDRILDEVCARLAEALTARKVNWEIVGDSTAVKGRQSPTGPLLPSIDLANSSRRSKEMTPRIAAAKKSAERATASDYDTGRRLAQQTAATVSVPTTESPRYRLLIGELAGGRRLLSDDVALLEAVAVMSARRIDAVRVVHERCLRDLHEQEIHKLATEAELRALRAQINPHFLFNALTTLGYLIQTAPERAMDTLMRLTSLLRGVLRRSDGEFSTLGEEIELIESYLEIERARFEDRLRVRIDVPVSLRNTRIPALLIQPLVENAVKHGISPRRAGGEVVIQARTARGNTLQSSSEDMLQILVRDTGAGAGERELEHGRARGVGLANVEQRLKRHYGDLGSFSIRSAHGAGTTVEVILPSNGMKL